MNIINITFTAVLAMSAATGPAKLTFNSTNYTTSVVSVTKIKMSDKDFIRKAADGGIFEVNAAELAMKNSADTAVRAFAQSMATDHSKTNTELLSLAKKNQVEAPDMLSVKNEQKIKELDGKTADQFDLAYAQAMVLDHRETLTLFKTEARRGTDKDIKTWATTKVPILEHHLMMAQELVTRLEANQKQ